MAGRLRPHPIAVNNKACSAASCACAVATCACAAATYACLFCPTRRIDASAAQGRLLRRVHRDVILGLTLAAWNWIKLACRNYAARATAPNATGAGSARQVLAQQVSAQRVSAYVSYPVQGRKPTGAHKPGAQKRSRRLEQTDATRTNLPSMQDSHAVGA